MSNYFANSATIIDFLLFVFVATLVIASVLSFSEYQRERAARLMLSTELKMNTIKARHLRDDNMKLGDELHVYQETDASFYQQTGQRLLEFGAGHIFDRIKTLKVERAEALKKVEELKSANTLLKSDQNNAMNARKEKRQSLLKDDLDKANGRLISARHEAELLAEQISLIKTYGNFEIKKIDHVEKVYFMGDCRNSQSLKDTFMSFPAESVPFNTLPVHPWKDYDKIRLDEVDERSSDNEPRFAMAQFDVFESMIKNKINSALILQDSAVLRHDFASDLHNIKGSWDMLLLGATTVRPGENEEGLVRGGYHWSSAGYIMTLNGAKKMMEMKRAYMNNFIPFDDFVAALSQDLVPMPGSAQASDDPMEAVQLYYYYEAQRKHQVPLKVLSAPRAVLKPNVAKGCSSQVRQVSHVEQDSLAQLKSYPSETLKKARRMKHVEQDKDSSAASKTKPVSTS